MEGLCMKGGLHGEGSAWKGVCMEGRGSAWREGGLHGGRVLCLGRPPPPYEQNDTRL